MLVIWMFVGQCLIPCYEYDGGIIYVVWCVMGNIKNWCQTMSK